MSSPPDSNTAVQPDPTTAPSYPRHWEADVVLRDGRVAHLRPILPEDGDELTRFYEGVSDESRYLRFFSPMPRLSPRDVHRFTHVDHHDRVGFVMTVADRIIGFGQYERLNQDEHDHLEAEVAFLVQDAHQGRGIAQLFLEHLAQAARESGIDMFVAHVLPGNKAMIGLFQAAGYSLVRTYEDGELRLEFPVGSTKTSLEVMQAREHRAEATSIQRFLQARSVAIVGASRHRDTLGHALVRNAVLGGFAGRIYAVNPHTEAVAGLPAYPTVSEIPAEVDIAVVAVPHEHVADVVLDCANKGVHGIVVVSSGFAETGQEGRRRQRRLVNLARGYGLRVVGPNALGLINTANEVSLNASIAPVMPPRGRAGFFCQSGALGVAILENITRRGLGISTFVSAGNRADVSGNDLLQYWEEDEATEVVLLYLESLGNPRKFSRIARRVSRRKPIIAVKSGRATQGVPMGHSVRESVLGQVAVDAMFRQAGVIQVDTLDEMFDVAQLLAHQPLPAGNRVGIVGNSDALALLASDAAVGAGLDVVFSRALPSMSSPDELATALESAAQDPQTDAVLAVYIPPLPMRGPEVGLALAAVGSSNDKPILSTFLATEGIPELLRVPGEDGVSAGRGSVPSYTSPEAAVRALARAVEYARWRREPETEVLLPSQLEHSTGADLVHEVLSHDPAGRALTCSELSDLLAAYGVTYWEPVAVHTVDEALQAAESLGWDVVLKATAAHWRHRPDLEHIWRNLGDAAEVKQAWQQLQAMTPDPAAAGLVVQRRAPLGVPVSIRGVEDPLFGPVISFGISGVASELLGDRSYRIPPVHSGDVAAMIREIRSAPLLLGYRGTQPVSLEAVEAVLSRVALLKNDLPEVTSLELPLVMAGAEDCVVLTGSARVEMRADSRSDWFARRLNGQLGDTSIG